MRIVRALDDDINRRNKSLILTRAGKIEKYRRERWFIGSCITDDEDNI